jgi:hypothetical protein
MTDPRAKNAIEFIREQVDELEQRLRELKLTANSVARAAGLPPVYGMATAAQFGAAPPAMQIAKPISPDQFAAFTSPSLAARAFLAFRGKSFGAVSLDEICDALVAGGYPSARDDEESKLALRLALGKDTELARLKNGYYVLAAWLKRDRTKTPTAGSLPPTHDHGPAATRGREGR